jgi:hypothetical protein
MFEHRRTAHPLQEEDLQAALNELTDRWRREASADQETRRFEGKAAHLTASFEAGAIHLSEVRAAQAMIGVQEARRARAVAAFCRSRPASLDRSDSEAGAAAAATRAARPEALAVVSEWAVDEVAVALSLTQSGASRMVVQSLLLVDRLPGTLAALQRGELTWDHARVMTEFIAPLGDAVRLPAEQRLLQRLGRKTPTQLRAAAHRVVARLDAEVIARRIREAIRDRRVSVYPGADGMSTLATTLPTPVARAVEDALGQYADAAATPGDDRTRAQRMADCLVDLVLRPGEHGLAPVQAHLTVVATVQTLAGTDDEPGEVNGDLVPAEMVRRLAQSLGLLPARDDPPADTDAAHPPAYPPAPTAAPDQQAPPKGLGRSALADLLGIQTLTGTAVAHRPHIAAVDELTGQLLALTDAAGLRAGQALGPPPATHAYSPTAALERFVRLRDRRCRFPGCRKRPVGCDQDHTMPWPSGPTAHDNLCCLCRHHHRLSHQAPGWQLRGVPDGGLEWTTPTGEVLTTHAPRFGADDDLPPPEQHPGPRDHSARPQHPARRERPTRPEPPGRPPTAEDDPPSF